MYLRKRNEFLNLFICDFVTRQNPTTTTSNLALGTCLYQSDYYLVNDQGPIAIRVYFSS